MASASDVPAKYDLVVNGQGFVFLDALTPNIPFRTHRAIYSASPTFLERTNVSGAYGDNQQDFWLTASQNDWSLGEQQRFFRSTDSTSIRRYWQGQNVDVSTPGQVSLQPAVKTNISFSGAVIAGTGIAYTNNLLYVVDSTTLYSIDGTGTKTSIGAHGAGTPFSRGMASDGASIFIAGLTNLRAYNILGASFSTFDANAYESIAFAGNVLYGMTSTMTDFGHFSTGGTFTSLYTFKDSAGNSRGFVTSIKAWGADVLVLRATSEAERGGELWLYDGTGLAPIAELPPNFRADQMEVLNGVVYIAGVFTTNSPNQFRPAIFYYANGNIGLLWKATGTIAASSSALPSLTAFQNGLVFTDETLGNFMFYDATSGGVSTIGTFTTGSVAWSNGSSGILTTGGTSFGHLRQSTSFYFFPDSSTASSGYIQTSQFDFDSSLTKLFRGITVDFDSATDGNGGTVDIAYATNGSTSFTTLQTGATAGTEYTISGVTGRTITVKVTLNKGTSTLGPVLKRIYVRAAPKLQSFRKREYIVDMTGAQPDSPRRLRDGSPNPAFPFDDVSTLNTTINALSPVSITDRFGTFTGIVEPDTSEIYEMHSQNQLPAKSGSFVAKIVVREV